MNPFERIALEQEGRRIMNDVGGTGLAVLFTLALAVLIFAVGPFMLIWAVSKLWNVPACYDVWHWLAGFLFMMCLRGASCGKKRE